MVNVIERPPYKEEESEIIRLYNKVNEMIDTFYLPYVETSIQAPSTSSHVFWISPREKLKRIEENIKELQRKANSNSNFSYKIEELQRKFQELQKEIEEVPIRLKKQIAYYREVQKRRLERGGYFYLESCNDYLTKVEMQEIIEGKRPLFYYHGTKLKTLEFILLQGGLVPQARILLKEAVKKYKKGKLTREELLQEFERYRREKEESKKKFKSYVIREIDLKNAQKEKIKEIINKFREEFNQLQIGQDKEKFGKAQKLLEILRQINLNLGVTGFIDIELSEYRAIPEIPISATIYPPQLNNLLLIYSVTNAMIQNNLKEEAKNYIVSFLAPYLDPNSALFTLSNLLESLGFKEEASNINSLSIENIEDIVKNLESVVKRIKTIIKESLEKYIKESKNYKDIELEEINQLVDEIFESLRLYFLLNNYEKISPDLIRIQEELRSLWRDFDKFKDRDKWFVYFGADEPYVSRETFKSILRYTYEKLILHSIDKVIGQNPGIILEFKPSIYNLILWEEIEKPHKELRRIEEIGYDARNPQRKLYATTIEYYDAPEKSTIPAAISGKLTYDLITDKSVPLFYLNRIYTSSENIPIVRELLRSYGLEDIEVCVFEEQEKFYQKALEEINEVLSNTNN
jgi:hypothetical protein